MQVTGVLNSDTPMAHHTVVPLCTDVAGTVRVDCTVPDEDGRVTLVIPRLTSQYVMMILPVPTEHNGTEHLYQPVQSLTLEPLKN